MEIVLGIGRVKLTAESPSECSQRLNLTLEKLNLVIQKYDEERSCMRLIHEPEFESSCDFTVSAPVKDLKTRRGSIDRVSRPSEIERQRSLIAFADRAKRQEILVVEVCASIRPIFVDLVKVSEEPDFLPDSVTERLKAILAAKSPPKTERLGGIADVRVCVEITGEKLAIAVSGQDVNNSVVAALESYTLKAVVDTEVYSFRLALTLPFLCR